MHLLRARRHLHTRPRSFTVTNPHIVKRDDILILMSSYPFALLTLRYRSWFRRTVAHNPNPSEEHNTQNRSDDSKSKSRPLSGAVHPKCVPIWANFCFDTIEHNRCYRDTESGAQLYNRFSRHEHELWVKNCKLRTCIIVLKRAPATLCSCGRANLAMKSVPAAKTKSAPITETTVATKA